MADTGEKRTVAIAPFYEDESVTIYHGDCREILPDLSLSGIAATITDPPYCSGDRFWQECAMSSDNGQSTTAKGCLSLAVASALFVVLIEWAVPWIGNTTLRDQCEKQGGTYIFWGAHCVAPYPTTTTPAAHTNAEADR